MTNEQLQDATDDLDRMTAQVEESSRSLERIAALITEQRFLVFAGDLYYPRGGWDDFRGAYSTAAEAFERGRAGKRDWWYVVDLHEMREVAEP